MATPTPTPTPLTTLEWEGWELVHEDGFIFKRKKRRLDPTTLVRAPDPAPDPAAELKAKRKRKRNALLKLKEKYQKELSLWEHLSNTLKAMEERAKSSQVAAESEGEKGQENGGEGLDSVVSVESLSGSLLNEVFLLVEAQEAIIRDVSHLCDVAESLCSSQEEMANRYFLDLPIWNSPRELMASLCEN